MFSFFPHSLERDGLRSQGWVHLMTFVSSIWWTECLWGPLSSFQYLTNFLIHFPLNFSSHVNFHVWHTLLIFSPLKLTEHTSLHWSTRRRCRLEIELNYFWSRRLWLVGASPWLAGLMRISFYFIEKLKVWVFENCACIMPCALKIVPLRRHRSFLRQLRLARSKQPGCFPDTCRSSQHSSKKSTSSQPCIQTPLPGVQTGTNPHSSHRWPVCLLGGHISYALCL